MGTASSSLTFFQQIGGTVGLTVAGTVFASRLIAEIPDQLVRAGVPHQMVDQFEAQGATNFDLTGTGDLGARILAQVPATFRALVEPQIPNIVAGIHEAFSIAVGSTFWIGILGALIAAAAVLTLKEVQLRTTFEMPAEAGAGAEDDFAHEPTGGVLPAGD